MGFCAALAGGVTEWLSANLNYLLAVIPFCQSSRDIYPRAGSGRRIAAVGGLRRRLASGGVSLVRRHWL
jgi:hypothetical protein